MTKKQIFETYSQSATASDAIYRVARRLRHHLALVLKQRRIGLTPEQWRLLLQLAEKDGQSQSALADPMLNDRPNITRITDGLERRGLVRRTPSPDDRRRSLIFLSKTGKAMINSYLADIVEEKGKYFEGLNEADIRELNRILAIIENNFH